MYDLLLPRTDAGVLVQFIVVITLFALVSFLVRRQPEWRIFAIGAGVLTVSLMAARAIH